LFIRGEPVLIERGLHVDRHLTVEVGCV
jgi:hypothetical protein